ncbi:hypothetical protein HN51_008768, partial [Arachis hypogaea]
TTLVIGPQAVTGMWRMRGKHTGTSVANTQGRSAATAQGRAATTMQGQVVAEKE